MQVPAPITKLAQNLKRHAPLLAALLLGSVAAALGWYYLKSSEREIAENLERSAISGRTEVVVAAQPLPGGIAVTRDMVAVRAIPNEFLHGDAILPEVFEPFLGRQLTVAVAPGKPLLGTFFAARQKVFAEQIEPGVRAVTIPVDEISSISGMLRAGDRIDFMFLIEKMEATDAERSIVPLLQDVEIRATGQITAEEFAARRARPAEAVDRDPYAQQRYTTVTVAIAPTDAQKLILAQRLGKIIAVLRNPRDRETLQRGTDAEDLASLVATFRPSRPAAAVSAAGTPRRVSEPGVEYIVGGAATQTMPVKP